MPKMFAAALLMLAVPSPILVAQEQPRTPPQPLGAADLGLDDHIPWRSDGQEFRERGRGEKVEVDRSALIDAACAEAKQQGRLVCWYVHRIQEKTLGGRQMYRAPVLDVYMRQTLFGDPEVAELLGNAFVPVRCVMDQALSDRYGLKPLQFVEPAVVFLDGDGKLVHYVERIRTFHGPWFADLLVRVLDHAGVQRSGEGVDGLRRVGRWRDALALALRDEQKDAADWLEVARLQRLLREPEQAMQSAQKAIDAATAATGDARSRAARQARDAAVGDAEAEQGLLLTLQGRLLEAQPLLERAFRSPGARAAEAGYRHALNTLRLGDEASAMRRFLIVAERFPDQLFGRRAHANATLGQDDRPLGAAFTGFESFAQLPESAWHGELPHDTTWRGDARSAAAMAADGVRFLLQQQRDDGGFSDARYAYWPSSEITPNVWVAITALCCTALWEHREAVPELRQELDRALRRGEDYLLDPKHLNRGANEDSYSDAYRLLYLSRRAAGSDGDERGRLVGRLNEIVQAAAQRQKQSGFWAHEYENAFVTGAMLQEALEARAAGATVPTDMIDRAATALLSARFQNGAYVYGGAAGEGRATDLKDAAGRMPVCEGTLLVVGRSDLDRLRFALDNFWQHVDRLEGVRRNDFHSDGELGGFFFFHSVFHTSEVLQLLPEAERAAHRDRFLALLQRIPELDGSWIDSHELGRSYGTAMALLTLRNCRAE